MTLAFAPGLRRLHRGVHRDTSLVAPERVIRGWDVPGLESRRSGPAPGKYIDQNNVHLLPPELINENNRLFVAGAADGGVPRRAVSAQPARVPRLQPVQSGLPQRRQAGHQPGAAARRRARGRRGGHPGRGDPHRGARGSHCGRRRGPGGGKGADPEWAPGEYRVSRRVRSCSPAGSVGTVPLLLRSGLRRALPPDSATASPAIPPTSWSASIRAPITNDVGHPKSFFVDRAEAEGYVLETCMYFPFTTAKNLTGFGAGAQRAHASLPAAADDPGRWPATRRTPGNRITVDRTGRPGGALPVHRPRSSSPWCGPPGRRRGSSSPPARSACTRPRPSRPLVEAAEADRSGPAHRRPAFSHRDDLDFGGAPHGRLRHGPRPGRLRHRQLGAGARASLAPRGRREPVPRFAGDQSLSHDHGAGGPGGRGCSRTCGASPGNA